MTTRDWMVVLLVNTVLTLSGVGAYHYLTMDRQMKLATVDLAQVYREKEQQFTAMIGKPNATEDDRKQAVANARDFAKRLPAALKEISSECGCIVLVGNAVAVRTDQVPDLTTALWAKVGI